MSGAAAETGGGAGEPRATDHVVGLERAREVRARWAAEGLRVVLTNGCFDLLHVGHVRSLRAARALGDRLIVAVNDDGSTRRLKGPGRPVLPLSERAEVLAALRSVDLVVPFGQDDAVAVVRALAPDVYTKGGDYDPLARRPPEADAAGALGADVVFVPYWSGRSTSQILEDIAGR